MKQFASRLIVMLLMVSMLIPSVVPQTASHPLTQKEVQMHLGGQPIADCSSDAGMTAFSCFMLGLPPFLCAIAGVVVLVVCVVEDALTPG